MNLGRRSWLVCEEEEDILKKKANATGKEYIFFFFDSFLLPFVVFSSKTWQGFALPGALHCASPLWLRQFHFQLQTVLGALLKQREELCWGYGRDCGQ